MDPTVFNTGPNYAFKYDLGYGATGWLLAQVAPNNTTLIIQDVRVENSDNHPRRYKTKSNNPKYEYGVKMGVAKISHILSNIISIVQQSYPDLAQISASRITGARKMLQVSLFAKIT